MSKSEEWHTLQSLASLKTCADLPPSKGPDKKLGSKHRPVLDVEPDDIVVDVLHLLLRVTDVLLRNLIFKMVELDLKTRRKGAKENLDSLVSVIRSQGILSVVEQAILCIIYCILLGVSFAVWESRDTAGRVQKGQLEWTSLNGTEKLKLLRQLPAFFSTVLPETLVSPTCGRYKC